MLKTILSQVKEFKRVSILTPVFVLGEVILEMVIPLLMASIIDEGVTAGNIDHIKTTGLWMLLLAVVSLWILLAAVEVFTPMLASDVQAQMEDALRQSTLAGPLVNWNPLDIMFQ